MDKVRARDVPEVTGIGQKPGLPHMLGADGQSVAGNRRSAADLALFELSEFVKAHCVCRITRSGTGGPVAVRLHKF